MLAMALLLALTFSIKAQTQTFATSGTFTVPAGVTTIKVECWGGGGAGGQASTSSDGKGGGGGGAYASSNVPVTSGNTYTVTVGAGGNAGVNTNSTSGGQSSFGVLVIAHGGAHGDNATNTGTGGAGGLASGSTGTTKHSGGNGGDGRWTPVYGGGGGGGSSATASGDGVNGGSFNNANGGAGGNGGNGDGGNGGNYNNSGLDGTSPGGGGGGRGDYGNDSGNGGSGQVIVTWTIPAGYCNGYASTLVSQFGTGVDNAISSLGPPDNAFATIFDHNGGFVVQLDNLLTSGETIDILWRRNGITLANPQVRVDFSTDGANWTTGVSRTETSLTWVTQNIVLPINTRYIRFFETNEYNIDIDAISYYTPGVGTPTAILISAGTEPTCQLTNATTTTTYSTTATNNTGFNWSLSDNSAGNIDASGIMTWANGFFGTVNIQVTASGCNGPSPQVIHAVTVNPSPTITGTFSVCGVGSPTQLTGSGIAAALNPWVSASPAIATVDGAGLVSGVATGTSVITYTDNNGCSTNETITVGLLPTTTGVTICQGGTGSSLTSLITCPAGVTMPNGPNNSGSSANTNGPGNNFWINPDFIVSPGGLYAAAILHNNSPTDYLQGTNYGFAIPVNAIISGITVSINRQSSSSNGIDDDMLNLLKNNIIVGTNKGTTTNWPTSMAVATYGGASDLWGTTWTALEINNTNFGVSFSVKNQNGTDRIATVDYMKITVSYSIPGTLDWYTTSSGGSSIYSGASFDPVVDGDLANTDTPATTTYYAECSTAPGCRTATDFTINPSPTLTGASQAATICDGSTATINLTGLLASSTSTVDYTINGIPQTAITGVVANATGAASFTSAVLIGANNGQTLQITGITTTSTTPNCSAVFTQDVLISVNPSTGPTTFTSGLSTVCQDAADETYTATASNSTSIAYSVLPVAAGEINPSTGVINWNTAFTGTVIITATSTGLCGTTFATLDVTVNPSVVTPVFVLGTNSTRYQILESVPYTATATNSTGISYVLDATSIAGGNSISALGVVTYSPTWSGPSTITATATGCNGPTAAIHTVRTDWCFALFAGAGAILNTGASTIVTGDVGTHAGSFTGFTPGMIVGQMHVADPTSVQAKADTELAYTTLFNTTCITPIGLTMGADQILQPGVYCTNDATSLSGNLTLDGNNIPDASFIIKIGGALSTATNSTVTLINGADLKNVFWQVTGVVNLGINSLFQGTVINVGALNLLDGSTLWGRAITTAGAISLNNSTVSSICAPIPCMNDNIPPVFTVPLLNAGYCVEDIYQAIYKDGAEGTTTDLTFVRPDYFTLLIADFNMLDLKSLADNCALLANPITWTITFADGHDLTGSGQFSTYVPIIPPLSGIEFPLGTNHITYTVTDLAGNTIVKSIDLVVTPRPGFD